MTLTVAGVECENRAYDERADVLYLTVDGYDAGGNPPCADATPEGSGGPWRRRHEAAGSLTVKVTRDRVERPFAPTDVICSS